MTSPDIRETLNTLQDYLLHLRTLSLTPGETFREEVWHLYQDLCLHLGTSGDAAAQNADDGSLDGLIERCREMVEAEMMAGR